MPKPPDWNSRLTYFTLIWLDLRFDEDFLFLKTNLCEIQIWALRGQSRSNLHGLGVDQGPKETSGLIFQDANNTRLKQKIDMHLPKISFSQEGVLMIRRGSFVIQFHVKSEKVFAPRGRRSVWNGFTKILPNKVVDFCLRHKILWRFGPKKLSFSRKKVRSVEPPKCYDSLRSVFTKYFAEERPAKGRKKLCVIIEPSFSICLDRFHGKVKIWAVKVIVITKYFARSKASKCFDLSRLFSRKKSSKAATIKSGVS